MKKRKVGRNREDELYYREERNRGKEDEKRRMKTKNE